jgi:hypothetical protein
VGALPLLQGRRNAQDGPEDGAGHPPTSYTFVVELAGDMRLILRLENVGPESKQMKIGVPRRIFREIL